MSTLAEFMIFSGADNRPPMLEKHLYDSWKSKMEHYMQNREHERMILESVEHGLLIWPTIEENGVTRTKKYEALSATEKIQAYCILKATNIILQGLPSDVYSLVNHHRVSKDLWERVQLLMQGLTSQEQVGIIQVNVLTAKEKVTWQDNAQNQRGKRDATWFRDKVLLVEAQGSGKVLNKEELEFLADPRVAEGPNTQTVITHNAAYQADDLDAYDFDCDEFSIAKAVLMANLSSYESDVLSEVVQIVCGIWTPDRSQLTNFVHKFLGIVKFDNDQIAKITGYGDYQIGNITILRVYYVEGLRHNLFSDGQFYDSDLKVAFRKHTSKTNPDEMDRRLSHLNFGAINHMAKNGLVRGLPKLKFEKDHLCLACAMGKSKKQSHKPKSEDTNQEKLYLLHMDLCGPMRVASINGKKYILVSTLHIAFQDFKEKAEAQQEEQAQVLYNRVAELEAHVMDVSSRLEGELYPTYLTTLAGRRCMQEGLEAGYEHEVAETQLSMVEAYNPEAARTSYFDAVRALEDVDFPIVNLLKSKKDARMDEVLDCFILDGPLADLPEAAYLQPCLEQLSVPIHHSDDKAIIEETSLSLINA
ncbi:retrovirus-related pol polyprotein from transposon TNT 1-94 [Tanacetum coccineum]|uniref:Retrovirus-related pol polyprotein from transposon TNT 1-94 n=1 Tax=Tanacetum coccineum TaxID=301880 RepID=A0ABQ5HXM7_9ASTR